LKNKKELNVVKIMVRKYDIADYNNIADYEYLH